MHTHSINPLRWVPPKHYPFYPRAASEIHVIDVPGTGPEDVLVRPDGTVWTGIEDGRILAVEPKSGTIREIANTGGRPLGLENHPDGGVVICDSERGLLLWHTDGTITVLADELDGQKFLAVNNASVGRDGTIWFTDSSQHFRVPEFQGDLIEHNPTGRLLRRAPNGDLRVVIEGLAFANGVALTRDEKAVIVAETGGYVMHKFDIASGHLSQFGPVLPGFPDNLALDGNGLLWVALASPRNRLLDFLLPKAPVFRSLLWRLPQALLPNAASIIWVQAYDHAGKLIHDVRGKHPRFGMTTGVRADGHRIWLGSLHSTAIAAIAV